MAVGRTEHAEMQQVMLVLARGCKDCTSRLQWEEAGSLVDLELSLADKSIHH